LNNTLLSYFRGNSLPPEIRPSLAINRTWALVASKTATTTGIAIPTPALKSAIFKSKTKKPKDLRLFAYLPFDSLIRDYMTFTLVNTLYRYLGTNGPKVLKDVYKIPSGLVLVS
jgi:hypothetical protein